LEASAKARWWGDDLGALSLLFSLPLLIGLSLYGKW